MDLSLAISSSRIWQVRIHLLIWGKIIARITLKLTAISNHLSLCFIEGTKPNLKRLWIWSKNKKIKLIVINARLKFGIENIHWGTTMLYI